MVNKMLLLLFVLLIAPTLLALGVNIPAPATNITSIVTNLSTNFSLYANNSQFLRGYTPFNLPVANLSDLNVLGFASARNLTWFKRDANNNYLSIGGAVDIGKIATSSLVYANDTGADDSLALCSKGTGSVFVNYNLSSGTNCGTGGLKIYDGGTTNNVYINKGVYTDSTGQVNFGIATSIIEGALGVGTVAVSGNILNVAGKTGANSVTEGDYIFLKTGDGYTSYADGWTNAGDFYLTTGDGGFDSFESTGGTGGDILITTGNSVYSSAGNIRLTAGAGVIDNGDIVFQTKTLRGNNIKSYYGTSYNTALYYDGTNFIINPQSAGSGGVVIGSASDSNIGNVPLLIDNFNNNNDLIIGTYQSTLTSGGTFNFKTASGTKASPKALNNSHRVGGLFFGGYDGSVGFQNSAAIIAITENQTSANYVPIGYYFYTGTSGTNRFLRFGINSSGTSIFNYPVLANETNIIVQQNITSKNINVTANLNVLGNLTAKIPYGMFSLNYTQTMDSANTPYIVNFTNVEDNYNVNLVGGQNITIGESGDYLITVSAIFSVASPNKKVEFWVQKTNATGKMDNVIRSNTIMTLATASTQIPLAVPFILDLNTSDKIRFMMATDNAGSQLLYTTNTTYSPETPSIIVTVNKIGEITP